MNNPALIDSIDWKNLLLVVVLLINLALVSVSYFKSRRQKANIAWSVAVGTVIIWVMAMIFYRSATPATSLLGAKVLHISAAIIPLAFLYFTFIYPENEWPIPRWQRFLAAVPTLLMIVLIVSPNILIREVIAKPGREKETVWGPYYFLYVLYILGYFSWPLVNLFKKYRKYRGKIKSQIAYMLLGTAIAISLGSIFNLVLPALGYFELNWLGQVMTLFMVGFITYAIAAYQLFDIKVLLTQVLVGVIAVLLLVNVVVSETIFEYAWKGGLFVAFLVFGYLLIKSVLQEIKRREEIEKLVNSLALSEQKIKEQLADLERAHERLKGLDKMKDDFISITSHELRTPMTAIQGYLWMLEKKGGELNEKQARYLERAQKGSARMLSLINDMLDVSRIEQERVELEIKEVDLAPIIKNVIEELKVRAEKKKLKLEWVRGKERLPRVKADEEKVHRVLTNLLDNAVKFTEKGSITVDAYRKGRSVQINVTDTGRGIAKGDLPRLFKKFGRLESDFVTAAEAGGTGLGLYISRALVERMRGKMSVQSKVNKGSTFSITLPI